MLIIFFIASRQQHGLFGHTAHEPAGDAQRTPPNQQNTPVGVKATRPQKKWREKIYE